MTKPTPDRLVWCDQMFSNAAFSPQARIVAYVIARALNWEDRTLKVDPDQLAQRAGLSFDELHAALRELESVLGVRYGA